MQEDFEAVGSIKVKDGLYMGDEYAAQDIEQLKINKINYVVNCAGQDSYNYWESEGIVYMTINWMDTDQQVLFENKGNVLNQIYEFIEIALTKGESVLVHSLRGQNRCTVAMVGYLMKKYRWSLRKSLEYLRFKRPHLPLRPTFYSQLLNLENKLFNMSLDGRTDTWHEVSDIPGSDELVVTHTFLNTKIAAAESTSDVSTAKSSKQSRISWAEELTSQVEIEVHSEEYDEEDEEEENSEVDSKTSLGAFMPENDAEAVPAPLSWNIKSSSCDQVGSMKSILRAEARFVAPETVIRRVVSANVSSRNTNNDIRESARTEHAKQNFIKKVRPNSSTSHVRATLTSKTRVSSATRKMETALAAPSSSQNGGNVINITINNFISENNNNAQNGSKHLPGRKLTVNSKLKKNTSSSSATSLDLLQLFAKSDIINSINHEVPQQKISLSKRPASSVSGQDREMDAWNRTPVAESMEPLTITGLSASRYTNKQIFNQSAPNFRKVAEVPVKCFGGPQYEVNNQFSSTMDNLYQQRPSNYANQGRFLPIKVMSNARFFEHSNAVKDTRSKAFKRPASAVNNSTPTKNPLESPYYHPSNNSLHIKRAKEIRSEIQNTKVKAIPSKQNGAKNVLIRSKLRTPSPKYYQGHNFFTSTC